MRRFLWKQSPGETTGPDLFALRKRFYFGSGFGGNPPRELFSCRFMVRVSGQIGRFVGVCPVIVEFLRSVGVADVAPVAGPNGMIAEVGRGDRRPVSRGGGVLQLGDEGESLEKPVLREVTERDEGGKNIDKTDGLDTELTRFDAGACKKKGNFRRLLL